MLAHQHPLAVGGDLVLRVGHHHVPAPATAHRVALAVANADLVRSAAGKHPILARPAPNLISAAPGA